MVWTSQKPKPHCEIWPITVLQPNNMSVVPWCQGPGDWFENFVLGPLPMRCLDAVRSKTWVTDGMDELPVPLPPPPKSNTMVDGYCDDIYCL